MVRKIKVAKFISIVFLFMLSIGTTGCSPKEMKEVDKCWDIYSKKTDLKEAIEYGKFVVNKHPENVGVYRCLAAAYYDAGYFKEAYNTIKKALDIAEGKWCVDDADKLYKASLYKVAGNYAIEVDLDKAIEYYSKGLKEFSEINGTPLFFEGTKDISIDDVNIISFKDSIGYAYYLKGDVNSSIKYLRDALSIIRNSNYRIHLKDELYVYSDLAMTYYKNGNNELAEEFLQKAIDREKNSDEFVYYTEAYDIKIKIGDACRILNMYECAKEHYLDAVSYARKRNDEHREALAYKHLGELSKEYYKRAYELFKLINADGYAQMMLEKINKKESTQENL
jgi:tetratricopeptide (TPR) repeat protein